MSFDGRVFLLDSEWDTYMRRMPVRYIVKRHSRVCVHCGEPGSEDNPLQHSHMIPFGIGIKQFKLTPEYLDSSSNIVSAHRRICNKAVELSMVDIHALVSRLLVQTKTPAEAGVFIAAHYPLITSTSGPDAHR